jgi:hypothetical protein
VFTVGLNVVGGDTQQQCGARIGSSRRLGNQLMGRGCPLGGASLDERDPAGHEG